MKHYYRVILLTLTSIALAGESRSQDGSTTYDNAAPPIVVPASPTAAPLLGQLMCPSTITREDKSWTFRFIP